MVPLEAAAVAICVALWKVAPGRYARGVPLGVAATGLLVTAWNASIPIVAP